MQQGNYRIAARLPAKESLKQKNYSEIGWRRHGPVAPATVTCLSMNASGKPYLTIITELPARSNTWKAMSVSNSHHLGLFDDRAMTMTE